MKIKSIFTLIIATLMMFFNTINVFAVSLDELPQSEDYELVNVTYDGIESIDSYSSYARAVGAFEANAEDYSNLAIVLNGKVLKAEYAIVQVAGSEACDYTVEFVNDGSNTSNYTNGCYGTDAAYVDTNEKATKVEFVISGAMGWVSMDDVTIIPLEMINSTLTTYKVVEGKLIHQIKFGLDHDNYDAIIDLGTAPDYLEEGKAYISYDGHYFYDSDYLNVFMDDYKANNRDNAINNGNPYYNYYQYVSHRSLTNYTVEEITNYLRDNLQLNAPVYNYLDLDVNSQNDLVNHSQYYGQEGSFFQYQYQYGANAVMMLALSMNESAYGRSSLAFTRNNLFGHAAYDSDVEKNASRYLSVDSSVYSHAKYYISGSYCNPQKFQFHGGFFGNKESGMSVSYASDPYWGEKAASNYMKIDNALGNKDLNSYTLGIKTSYEKVDVYLYPEEGSDTIYSTSEDPNYAFTIVNAFSNDGGDWYTVQIDPTINEDGNVDTLYFYDYKNNVGYIRQSDVEIILQGNNEEKTFVNVTFDGNGGTFNEEESSISYAIPSQEIPAVKTPVKEGYVFTNWDKDITNVSEDTTYVAQYKELTNIELAALPIQYFEYNDRIDLKGGLLQATYSDGTTEDIPLTTSMVSGFSLKEEGEQEVSVTYGGKVVTYPITVDMQLDTIRNENKAEIDDLTTTLDGVEELNEEQTNRILALKNKMDTYMVPYLPQQEFRSIDHLIRLAIGDKINYVLAKNDYDASVSGLSLSIDITKSLQNKFINDTYKITINEKVDEDTINAITKLSDGYDYEYISAFHVAAQKNLDNFSLNAPIQISIKKPEGHTNPSEVFTVFRYDDGDIIQCYTRQTDDYIQFMTMGFGDFTITSKESVNEYYNDNVVENLTVENSDTDIPSMIAIGAISVMIFVVLLIIFILFRRSRKR